MKKTLTLWNNTEIPRLGLGCWAIGGPFYSGEQPLGYSGEDDNESRRAILTAIDLGIKWFDTADVYGAGHSERLLGETVGNRDDVFIATKFGCVFNEQSKQMSGENWSNDYIVSAIENSLRRLNRDKIDLLFLHLNVLPKEDAEPVFYALDSAVKQGKIEAYGWSTDFSDRAESASKHSNFKAIQYGMNIFLDAAAMCEVAERHSLVSFIRSPLAMGLLTGKFKHDSRLPDDDVRSNNFEWMDYFKNGKTNPALVDSINNIGELLRYDGRSLAQGALGWLLAKSETAIPIPGFRLVEQVKENAMAIEKGPLPEHIMLEIDSLIDRT